MILTLGDLAMDILVKPSKPLSFGSDVTGEIHLFGGGSPANFSAWVALQGMEVAFMGKVGCDKAGDILSSQLQEMGVTISITRSESPTASILVLIDEKGERHMVTQRGASLNLTPQDLKEELFQRAQHLHLTAYSFFGGEGMVETATEALRLAKKHSLSISLDPSSYALLMDFGIERFLELTSCCHFFFPNQKEGESITRKKKKEEIFEALRSLYPVPLLKIGKEGVLYWNKGKISQVLAQEVPFVQDTTGAGDAFGAGFLVSYLQNSNIKQACHQGVYLASLAVRERGGRPSAIKVPF